MLIQKATAVTIRRVTASPNPPYYSLMGMHNPPHPGEFIREVYLEPFHITGRQLAVKLGVSPSTLSRVLNGSTGISSEMALRLSKALGRSPESWLTMQDNYDLWHARQSVNLDQVQKVEFHAAQHGPTGSDSAT